MNKYNLKRSKVSLPAINNIYDHTKLLLIVVYGYVRRGCRHSLMGMLPNDLMGVLVSFYKNQVLLCIETKESFSVMKVVPVASVLK